MGLLCKILSWTLGAIYFLYMQEQVHKLFFQFKMLNQSLCSLKTNTVNRNTHNIAQISSNALGRCNVGQW